MNRLAAVLRCTPGQAWTVVLGLLLAASTLAIGIPPVLRHQGFTPLAVPSGERAGAAPVEDAGQTTTSTVPETPVIETPETALPPAGPTVSTGFGIPSPTSTSPATTIPRTEPPIGPGDQPASKSPMVQRWAWAAASPSAEDEDALYIGALLGEDTHRSYVQVGAGHSELRLAVIDEVSGGILGTETDIVACPITETSWPEGGGQSLDEAPPFNCDSAHLGVTVADGFLTVDLAELGDIAITHGVALVPTLETTQTFRIRLQVEDPAAT